LKISEKLIGRDPNRSILYAVKKFFGSKSLSQRIIFLSKKEEQKENSAKYDLKRKVISSFLTDLSRKNRPAKHSHNQTSSLKSIDPIKLARKLLIM